MPAPPAYCRLTVLAPGTRADVAVPADVPAAELVPMLMELFGRHGDSARPEPWRLTGATGGVLPPDATLDELGVVDGELLRLGPMAPPPPPVVFDDPVDALAALTASDAEPARQRRAAVVLAGVVPAAALVLGGAGDGPAPYAWGALALGGLGATAAIVRAAQLGRDTAVRESSASPTAALLPALCAVPPAASAGWVAAPGPSDVARLLLAVVAAGTAAALAQVAVRTARSALIGIVLAAVLTAAAAVARLWFDVPTHAIAALTAAAVVSAVPLLPRLTLRLAGLPRPAVPTDATDLVAADTGRDLLPPADLATRARLARAVLAGLSGGCAVVAAVAAPVVAADGRSGWAGPVLAAVVAAVLLLRARGYADPPTAWVHLVAGTATATVLVASAALATGPVGRLGGALALLGGAAGVVVAVGRAPDVASPVLRRAVDITEGLLTVVAVPLALAAAGVFALVRGL
ncbi:type VII secretion integral membrane protein EccD [Pseudonocardia charpentierae]|uniref:Type VII secretion integral membrane protein EccD n=1 Tax=Pseudonocardia charpentierae TaxID=3075545 RepID=A0ABU2N410_9PSEU|nr:type VII secretion integral membrane protein EccD [Pseudonocardia sp. DSM 45834]MDT0348652.1 type VII secretion integral membrane protein EccD [Pseudonocardia sp. DSM 45834]